MGRLWYVVTLFYVSVNWAGHFLYSYFLLQHKNRIACPFVVTFSLQVNMAAIFEIYVVQVLQLKRRALFFVLILSLLNENCS
jgi:hypothetical protein